MSEINENPQAENEENVVYEYVELEEGQELPEGYEYEYEYVEVPEGGNGEISELDVVSQKTEEVPTEEIELASAAEIEAVLSPRNLEAEIEGTSVTVPVQESPAMAEAVSAPVNEEQRMPQITAPGSDMDLDMQLNDVQEPKFDMPQLEEIAEDVPMFEVGAPEPEQEEAGIPSLDSLPDVAEADIFAEINEPAEETVISAVEENAFILPEDIKFQNNDDDNEPKDWFDQSHLKSGAEVGSVDLDAYVNVPAENVAEPQSAAEQPDLDNQEVTVAKPVAEDASLAELTNLLSEMNEEIKEPEKVSEPTVISEDVTLPEVPEEVAVPDVETSAPAPTVIEEEVSAVDVEPVSVESGVDVSNDISIDDLLNEDSVPAIDAMAEAEPIEQAQPVSGVSPLPAETEEPGIPQIGEILPVVEGVSESVVEETKEIALPEKIQAETEPAAIAEVPVVEVQALEEPVIEIVPEPAVEEAKEIVAAVSEVKEEIEQAVVAASVAAAVIDTAREQEDIINPSTALPKVTDCSADLFAVKALAARMVSKNDGIQSFKGTEAVSALALDDINFEANELNAWNLVLFKQEIMPLTAKVSELELPHNPQVNRFVSLVKAGEQKAEFFNEDKLKILNTTDSCVAVQGRFVCGDLHTNSGLIVNDMLTIPLRDFAGKELSFDKPASGLLSGPNGTLLYFFNLLSLLVPNNEAAKIDAEKLQYKISKWYSGSLNDKYFEFNAQSPSGSFEGNDEIKAIHVNVNNSSYGWNVTFDNGLSMNLRDLREYQTRFGKMPSPNGVISYGQTKLTFSKVERIVVYESAQYYFYS